MFLWKIDFLRQLICLLIKMIFIDSNLPLRTILSSRIVASAFLEKLGLEIVSDNVGINAALDMFNFVAQQCYMCRSSEIVSFATLFVGILIIQNNAVWFENVKRIESVDISFVSMRKSVSNLAWIILIVFTKNIENAI